MGRRVAATKIVEFLGMKDFLKDRGYVDGKDQVTKFPNLMNLVNPFSMIGLLGHRSSVIFLMHPILHQKSKRRR